MTFRYLLLISFICSNTLVINSMNNTLKPNGKKTKPMKPRKSKELYAKYKKKRIKDQIRYCQKLNTSQMKKLQEQAKKQGDNETVEFIKKHEDTFLNINLLRQFRSTSVGTEQYEKVNSRLSDLKKSLHDDITREKRSIITK